VALHSGVHQRLDLSGFRHVGLEEGRVATGAQDFLDHLVAQRFVDVIDDDAGAFSRQAQGDALANAAAGARDDDGFVLDSNAGISCLLLK